MKRSKNLDMTYMAMYIALAVVLEYVNQFIPFLQMPQGGSINLAIIPVIIASYHLGWLKGMGVGVMWWFIGFIMGFNNWYLNPIQYALDYLVPAIVCGLACLLPRIGKISNIYTGVVAVGVVRFLCTVLSGVYFWFPEGSAAGSSAAWVYSLSYNFYYNFATLIVAIILVPLLVNRLKHTVKMVGIK